MGRFVEARLLCAHSAAMEAVAVFLSRPDVLDCFSERALTIFTRLFESIPNAEAEAIWEQRAGVCRPHFCTSGAGPQLQGTFCGSVNINNGRGWPNVRLFGINSLVSRQYFDQAPRIDFLRAPPVSSFVLRVWGWGFGTHESLGPAFMVPNYITAGKLKSALWEL